MKNGIPHRNFSPYGWWTATYLIRAAWDDDKEPSPAKHCLAWENTIILKAEDREAAYEKALSLASQNTSEFEDDSGKRTGRWVLEGLTSLLPIYDDLTDGAEISWVEHENRTVKKIRSWVKRKEELEVFDDTPSIGDKS